MYEKDTGLMLIGKNRGDVVAGRATNDAVNW